MCLRESISAWRVSCTFPIVYTCVTNTETHCYYRDPNLQLSLLDPTQIYNIFEVDLMKKPGRGLGLSIVGRKNEPGVYVSEVVKGGIAEADNRLMQGDQILAVNGQDLTNAMQEHAAAILKVS